jgi:hypothetical protein
MTGLALLFYEPWVDEISLAEYSEGDHTDIDRPRTTPLKHTSKARERASFSAVSYVQSQTCLRQFLATAMGDSTPEGMFQLVLQ